ncbi:uncharacterized protein LOC125847255 [Solanum stenotomum]|uniref:uncharacterized protein LOC125847255 n=1 Tax=Solanum stenotomum TaxID=172797 RepID=UPI0020D0F355|nr:uncharacterized protein LOC125847255 [Solanum stenotomum]
MSKRGKFECGSKIFCDILFDSVVWHLVPLLLIHFLRIDFTLIPSPWLGDFADVSCSQQSNIEETEQALKGKDEVIADKENIIKGKIEMIKSLSTEIGLFTGSG